MSLEICYLGVFKKTVKVMDKGEASQNLLWIKKIAFGTDVSLALLLLQIWTWVAGYLQ